MTLENAIKDIAQTVKETVSDAVKSVSEKYDAKIKELEERIDLTPVPEKGEKGDKGDSVTVADIEPILKSMIDALELPKGEKGDDGESVDMDEVKSIIADDVSKLQVPIPDISHLEAKIDEAIKSIPVPENGKDGVAPTPDEVAKSMEHIFCKWALDFERMANEKFDKALSAIPKPKDAIEIKEFDIQLEDDMRTVTVSLGDVSKSITIPTIIDRGVFKSGENYDSGDAVTYGGSLWIAKSNTNGDNVPTDSDCWRLAVKRGRDGKEVVKLDKPETVKVPQ